MASTPGPGSPMLRAIFFKCFPIPSPAPGGFNKLPIILWLPFKEMYRDPFANKQSKARRASFSRVLNNISIQAPASVDQNPLCSPTGDLWEEPAPDHAHDASISACRMETAFWSAHWGCAFPRQTREMESRVLSLGTRLWLSNPKKERCVHDVL